MGPLDTFKVFDIFHVFHWKIMISDHHHSCYTAVDTGWIYARNEQVTLNENTEGKDKGYRNEKPLSHPRMH